MTKREKLLIIVSLLQTVAIILLIATIVCIRFYVKDVLDNNFINVAKHNANVENTMEDEVLPLKVGGIRIAV